MAHVVKIKEPNQKPLLIQKMHQEKHVREIYTPLNLLYSKPGYAGVYLFFLFLLQNIDYGYSLEPPRRGGSSRGGSNVYPQSMF